MELIGVGAVALGIYLVAGAGPALIVTGGYFVAVAVLAQRNESPSEEVDNDATRNG